MELNIFLIQAFANSAVYIVCQVIVLGVLTLVSRIETEALLYAEEFELQSLSKENESNEIKRSFDFVMKNQWIGVFRFILDSVNLALIVMIAHISFSIALKTQSGINYALLATVLNSTIGFVIIGFFSVYMYRLELKEKSTKNLVKECITALLKNVGTVLIISSLVYIVGTLVWRVYV